MPSALQRVQGRGSEGLRTPLAAPSTQPWSCSAGSTAWGWTRHSRRILAHLEGCYMIYQMMQIRLELSYRCSCSIQWKEKINSLQTNHSISEHTCTDAFQVRSGQVTHWPSVPEWQLKTETLIKAISELGIEIFLFSLSTAGTVSFYFSLYIIPSLGQIWVTMRKALHKRLDSPTFYRLHR